MNLKATLEISAAGAHQFPQPDVPEIVFIGRSNVGKSSLLNVLTGYKQLARVSSTPGKTRQINFFRISDDMRFVDFPGYGYAKVSKQERASWSRLISAYFEQDRPLVLVHLLIDSRHKLQDSDASVLGWLTSRELPLQIVLTKIDKLKQKDRIRQVRELGAAFQELGSMVPALQFSAVKGIGKKELLRGIFSAVKDSNV